METDLSDATELPEVTALAAEVAACHAELREAREALARAQAGLAPATASLSDLTDEMSVRTRELDRTHDVLDAVLDAVDDAVVVVDQRRRVRGWSGGAVTLTGVSAASVRGRVLETRGPTADIALAAQQALRRAGEQKARADREFSVVVEGATVARATARALIDPTEGEVAAVVLTLEV